MSEIATDSATANATKLVIPLDSLPVGFEDNWAPSNETIIEDDDGYDEIGGIPVVGLVFMVIILSACIGASIFFLSYKQERSGWCKKKKRNTLGGEEDALFHLKSREEIERNLKVKTWQCPDKKNNNYSDEPSETEEASCDSDADEKSTANDSVVQSSVCSLQELRQQPRCILCSKRFTQNDSVTEANDSGCYHQYHRDCIISWLQKNDGCPVCKKTYIGRDVETA